MNLQKLILSLERGDELLHVINKPDDNTRKGMNTRENPSFITSCNAAAFCLIKCEHVLVLRHLKVQCAPVSSSPTNDCSYLGIYKGTPDPLIAWAIGSCLCTAMAYLFVIPWFWPSLLCDYSSCLLPLHSACPDLLPKYHDDCTSPSLTTSYAWCLCTASKNISCYCWRLPEGSVLGVPCKVQILVEEFKDEDQGAPQTLLLSVAIRQVYRQSADSPLPTGKPCYKRLGTNL